MAMKRSLRMWTWRGAVTALFIALLVWGDLPRGMEEFVLIGLGSGIFIMGAELVHNAAATPRSKEN